MRRSKHRSLILASIPGKEAMGCDLTCQTMEGLSTQVTKASKIRTFSNEAVEYFSYSRIKRGIGLLIIVVAMMGIGLIGTSEATEIPLAKVAKVNKLQMLSANSFGTKDVVFAFKENSRVFMFKKILMPLGFPIIKRYGRYYIDNSDYKSHIKPLFPTTQHNYKKIRVIALDAGHGGEDNGTTAKWYKLQEKSLAMDVCLRLAKLLDRNGYKVILTRLHDKKILLPERTQIANRAKADLFISIHFNSAPLSSASGIETFVLTPSQQASSYEAFSKNICRSFVGNAFDALNIVLGYCLQSSLIQQTSAIDRGVKHSTFTVLRDLKCPGILVECGFLSNREECKKITSPAYRDVLAQSICDGIIKFNDLLSE
ncbi:MAG: N-acetylmuramoyl-L-alanine amidase [Puniceicoccales bacterium]|jgi:N-acetylmuramoyl-L-alanine amidase|nr:N-acetylmuramoyl-L-alanine amidase [Puniceicoccales bacterium]